MADFYEFFLDGISCINCVRPIENKLSVNEPFIKNLQISAITKKISFDYTGSDSEKESVRRFLQEKVEDFGVTVRDLTPYEFYLDGISRGADLRPIADKLSVHEPFLKNLQIDAIGKKISFEVAGRDCGKETVRAFLQQVIEDSGVTVQDIGQQTMKQGWWQSLGDFFLSHWFQGASGTVAGIALLVLSLVSGGLPLAVMIAIAAGSTLLTLLLGAQSYYQAAVKLFRNGMLSMDTLFSISSIAVLAVSLTAFFVPWLPVMFEAGLLIFGFRHIGLAIEASIKQRMDLDKTFQHLLPVGTQVYDKESTATHLRVLEAIKINDELQLKSGEIIPLDGVCLNDDGLIYDTIKTGDTLPRRLIQGERLISGMWLAENSPPVRLKVNAALADSYLSRLDEGIREAHRKKAPIEETATKILQYFIPAVVGLAIFFGLLIGVLFTPALAIQCAITVLVSACPCTLGLVVPLAVTIGMQKGAENGVQFKSAQKLQGADSIDAVVFDLNGTLTTGLPIVCQMDLCDETISKTQMLGVAAAIEKRIGHPVAQAICDKADAEQVIPVVLPENTVFDRSHHSGVRATVNGDLWVIGNETIMQSDDIPLASLPDKLPLKDGESIVYVAKNNRLAGYFVLSDCLRNDARHTVNALHSLGKKVYICTGAEEKTALRYARMSGIPEENVRAACVGMSENADDKPKAQFISQLQSKGLKVAMVGDAGNDSLAIAKSDFGIAIKSHSGSEITQQEAGAIIQSGSLLPVANAFAVASQTVNNIRQNLGFSLGYNVIAILVSGGLLVGMGFVLNPGIGVALMIIQTVCVLLNAFRFQLQSMPPIASTVSAADGNSSFDTYQIIGKTMTPGVSKALRNELEVSREFVPSNPVALPETSEKLGLQDYKTMFVMAINETIPDKDSVASNINGSR